ncbi:MAG: T9SS type A sorting domain-containing protein [Flavobacteriales bacterium]|nr:T9SS type A sorting domain-containing protein [Flavobacteriales bacterium]
MKKLISILTLITVCNSGMAQIQQLMSNLGRGINVDVRCSCVDPDGNLIVGYLDKGRDSLQFEQWSPATKNWSKIFKVPTLLSAKLRSFHCITSDSQIFVSSSFLDQGKIKTGLFMAEGKSSRLLTNFVFKQDAGEITDLKYIDNQLVILGNFDSITLDSSSKAISNAILYDGKSFKSMNFGFNPDKFKLLDIPASFSHDTLLIATINNSILCYDFRQSGKWSILQSNFGIKNPISSITEIRNNWLLTFSNSDTIGILSGRSFFARLIKSKLNTPISVLNTKYGILIAESAPQGRILLLDSNDQVRLIFQNDNPFNVWSQITSNQKQSHIYYLSIAPIVYRNINFGNAVLLKPELGNGIDFDKIAIYAYYDLDESNSLTQGDEFPEYALVRNVTYDRLIKLNNGKANDLVPFYNDVEYELLSFKDSFCFKLVFSGNVRSNNTAPGVTSDTIYFPLQRIKEANLRIKGSGRRNARLEDTIDLFVDVKQYFCGQRTDNVNIQIELFPGTELIRSTPNFSSGSGNVYKYNTSISSFNSNKKILLKVKYPVGTFKIDDWVKHYVSVDANIVEDQRDNHDSILQKLVYSYDPNAKYCTPEGNVPDEFKTIRYYIEFQNEGNAEARRVIIVDTLQAVVPVSEFQMISCSHPYSVSLVNNVVTWTFDNINLPPKSLNETGSQGYIVFEARLKRKLEVGDSIKNKAFIYFDYNEPILTNFAIVYKGSENKEPKDSTENFLVYPNPAIKILNIENTSLFSQEISVYNVIGKNTQIFVLAPLETKELPVDTWARGVYFIRSAKGSIYKVLIQ